MISLSHKPVPLQDITLTRDPYTSGIRTRNPGTQAAADASLITLGHRTGQKNGVSGKYFKRFWRCLSSEMMAVVLTARPIIYAELCIAVDDNKKKLSSTSKFVPSDTQNYSQNILKAINFTSSKNSFTSSKRDLATFIFSLITLFLILSFLEIRADRLIHKIIPKVS
jgi:hypothetical protein